MMMHNVDPDDLLGKAYDSRIARRLAAFVVPYRARAIGVVVLMFVVAASDLMLPKIFSLGVDEVALYRRLSHLNLLGLAFMIALVVRFASQWGEFYLTSWLGNRVVFDLRNTMFRHLQTLSMAYIDRRGVGAIMTRIQNDVGVINEFFGDGIAGIIANMLILVGIVIVMFTTNWKLALLAFVVLPIMGVIMARWR